MKCENCGKNEVTFVYRSNVNGHVEEKHLCSDCAEKLGYTQRLGAQSQRMMQSFFGNSLFGNDFFDDFFSPMPSLLGRRMKMLEDPFDDFFAEMDSRAERLDLLHQVFRQFQTSIGRYRRNIVNRFVGIQFNALAADSGQGIDDVRPDFEQSELEYLKKAYRTGTDDDGIGFDWHSVNSGIHY